ncbi:MAG: hypothetical protein PSW75_01315 [bacterium]|nr:hypothetical protein [bacterium]MDI1337587.1 hypothetical protein [Lacunisphaera sp.]
MKTFALLALCATALLAGCESMSDRMQDRLSAVPPKTQTFAAPQAKVAAAAQQAFKRLDFTLTHTKAGQIEAVSRINSSAAFADARQLVAKVHLAESGPGQTDVEITLREEVTSKSFGGTHQQDMREHSFFALYFATLQQVLQDGAQSSAIEKH